MDNKLYPEEIEICSRRSLGNIDTVSRLCHTVNGSKETYTGAAKSVDLEPPRTMIRKGRGYPGFIRELLSAKKAAIK